jgi:hypothetical protein
MMTTPFGKTQNIITLMSNTEFIFNENDTINWRDKVNQEFLYQNKEWLPKTYSRRT